ncbi:MAG: inorganic phosphate transporter, partial [Myxococcales bacterium]|nr:inorganic phosphate transporter [Myxococcales bacterium]
MELDAATLIMAIAALSGFYMAWNIGANDVANAMGTSVGSGALTLRGAIIVAAIFEFGGALLVGGSVTSTIKNGIVDMSYFVGEAEEFALGMTCCLLAAALWLNLASWRGWPVSTTHSIVGAVVGFGIVGGGFAAVQWGKMGVIAASWVVSPLLGGLVAFTLFRILQKTVLDTEAPVKALRIMGPFMIAPIFFVLT